MLTPVSIYTLGFIHIILHLILLGVKGARDFKASCVFYHFILNCFKPVKPFLLLLCEKCFMNKV